MTCIVGIEHAGGVTLGADSAASDGWAITSRADTKLFRNGPYLFGFCGSFRMGQLLHYAFDPPKPPARKLDRFMVTVFIDAVRDCLLEGGFAEKRKSGPETGGTFLVAAAGRLWQIEDDYQVAQDAHGFDAIGSGAEVALGSLHTTAALRLSPEKRARAALTAAAELTAFVQGPFRVMTQKKGTR